MVSCIPTLSTACTVTAAVTAGLVIIGLLLGVGITLLKRQQRLPDIMYWNCPAGLQIQETDQVFFVVRGLRLWWWFF